MWANSKKVDVLILATEPFPYGGAATNRIISYAKVLAEDFKVRYVCISPDWTGNPANLPKGNLGAIKYEYATGSTEWNPKWSKLKKAIRIYKGRINAVKKLYEYNPDSVILASWNVNFTKFLIFVSKIKKFKLIIELTELTPLKKRGKGDKLISLYSKVGGILCISKEITDYLTRSISDSVELLHLPMSVDIDRFSSTKNLDENNDKYFAMVSGNNWERDGAIDSINAFLEFRKKHSEYRLKIAGTLNDHTEYSRNFKDIVEANLDNGVEYLGRLSSDRVPDFIMGATATLMTPHKDYASGGFPTKLGEYLASGVPVVCTAVSEIPKYLDRNNSFICPPNDIRFMVECMNKIVENSDKAKRVGERGRDIAKTVFNAYSYKTQLFDFVLDR